MENKQLNCFYIIVDVTTKDVYYCNHVTQKNMDNKNLVITKIVVNDIKTGSFCNGSLNYVKQEFDVYKFDDLPYIVNFTPFVE